MKKALPYSAALILTLFGLLTLFMSSSVIFDLFDIRAKQGNYVPFIVWTNFVCAFLYLGAAYGFIRRKKWVKNLLGVALVLLIIAFVRLKIHIANDGLYEIKTVKAMMFRMTVTTFFTIIAAFIAKNRQKQGNNNI